MNNVKRLCNFVTCRKNIIIRVGGLSLSFGRLYEDEIEKLHLTLISIFYVVTVK